MLLLVQVQLLLLLPAPPLLQAPLLLLQAPLLLQARLLLLQALLLMQARQLQALLQAPSLLRALLPGGLWVQQQLEQLALWVQQQRQVWLLVRLQLGQAL